MDIKFNKNKDENQLLVSELNRRLAKIKLGGGEKKMESQHKKGKLTARERVDYLLDNRDDFLEIGAFAAEGMYEEWGGCPSAGVVTGIGRVSGKLCVIAANDATVKAGAWFPMTAKNNIRAQEISIENNLPIIYLVDSAGVFLPMQDEIFPDKEHFGRQFRNNAIMSSKGIVQIAAIMGSCVAGGAYLPIMSDEALIVDGTGSVFLGGSYLVKSAVGEDIDNETLGGATTHCEISGVTDTKCENDKACLDAIKGIFDKMGESQIAGFNRIESKEPENPEGIYGHFPKSRNVQYDIVDVIKSLVDGSEFDQYKELYGKTIVCGFGRMDGWSVGIVANQRKTVKTKKGEMQMGGVIYSDSADKAARFIMNCNQRKIPLVFLHDVNGFMVGSRAEHSGIIKDGAKMVNAVSNSVVPKFTIVLGNSYGAGNYAMCGKAYDPRLIFAWPTAQIAVMSGVAAGKTLLQIKMSSLKGKGEELSEKDQKKHLAEIQEAYDQKLSPYYAASQLWVDGIIDPKDTRKVISTGIEAANHAPIGKMNIGVIQT